MNSVYHNTYSERHCYMHQCSQLYPNIFPLLHLHNRNLTLTIIVFNVFLIDEQASAKYFTVCIVKSHQNSHCETITTDFFYLILFSSRCLSSAQGVTGTITLNSNSDRINKWGIWSYGDGQTAYEQYMLVDVTKPADQVRSFVDVHGALL